VIFKIYNAKLRDILLKAPVTRGNFVLQILQGRFGGSVLIFIFTQPRGQNFLEIGIFLSYERKKIACKIPSCDARFGRGRTISYGNEVSLEVLDDHDGNAGSAGGMKSNAEATKLDESCHLREPFERYLDMSFGVDEYSMAAFSAKEDLGMWMRSLMTHLQVHFIAPCSRSQ
jgi:hypothetical protein